MDQDIRVNQDFVNLNVNSTNNSQEDEVLDDLKELIVTNLPQDMFSDEQIRIKFEDLFRSYSMNVKFYYFRALKRCYIKYDDSEVSINARYELDGYLFGCETLRVFFAEPIKLKNTSSSLKPPENTKAFLISPPASPPVGWESAYEDPPVINLNLITALSKLSPSKNYLCQFHESSLKRLFVFFVKLFYLKMNHVN
jgi:hypothetical protein